MEDKKPEEKATAPASDEKAAGKSEALTKPNEGEGDVITTDAKDDKGEPAPTTDPTGKQPNAFKKLFKRFGVYFLLVILIAVVGGVFVVVQSLNNKKTVSPPTASVASQALSQNDLKKLATSGSTSNGQTLTVQGNADFSGQVLVRNNLNVAGTVELGGSVTLSQLTASGTTNMASAQINSLQVAQPPVFQGLVTAQNGIDIAGPASFSSSVSMNQLTLTNLDLTGNVQLQVPNHLAFTGTQPGRTVNFGVLGNGGSASIFGSDTSGTININTGNNPIAGCYAKFVYNVPFQTVPHVLVSPINAGGGPTQYYVLRDSTTSWQLCTANASPPNSAFGFSYFVTE